MRVYHSTNARDFRHIQKRSQTHQELIVVVFNGIEGALQGRVMAISWMLLLLFRVIFEDLHCDFDVAQGLQRRTLTG